MNTEEMFLTILNRMNSIEASLTDLNAKMDKLDGRISDLRYDAVMELYLVRTEIHGRNKLLEKEIGTQSSKADNSIFAKDIEGYDKINLRLEVLERGYQELKEKIV